MGFPYFHKWQINDTNDMMEYLRRIGIFYGNIWIFKIFDGNINGKTISILGWFPWPWGHLWRFNDG